MMLCWGEDHAIFTHEEAEVVREDGKSLLDEPLFNLATGVDHSCALRASDNTAVCWGRDTDGEVSGAPAGVPLFAISVNCGYTCGIVLATMTPICWGTDQEGLISEVPICEESFLAEDTVNTNSVVVGGPEAPSVEVSGTTTVAAGIEGSGATNVAANIAYGILLGFVCVFLLHCVVRVSQRGFGSPSSADLPQMHAKWDKKSSKDELGDTSHVLAAMQPGVVQSPVPDKIPLVPCSSFPGDSGFPNDLDRQIQLINDQHLL
jgi:hypothetical protein